MSDTSTMHWEDYRGKEHSRVVNQTLDIRRFLGTPGYALLLVAANTQLGVPDLERWLDMMALEQPGVSRSPNWIQKRRWLFQQPGAKNQKGTRANADGAQEMAYAIMRANPAASLHNLRLLLRENGVTRSTEWIRRHRVTATTTTVSP